MTSFEEQLKNSTRNISLSTDERERMRLYLAEYQAHLPVRNDGRSDAVSAEPQKNVHTVGSYVFDIFKMARARTLVWSMVGLVLMATSGMTYAAEGAVPGDTLYGLKVNINEEIVGAFSFGAEARMMWEARRAERRLEEAGKLASTGALTPERERQVAERFERHIERVSEQTAAIGEDDPVRASDMNSMLENAFSAHEAILVSIAIDEQLSAESVKLLAGKVRGVAREFGRVQSQTEEVLAAAGAESGEEGDNESQESQSTFADMNEYDQRIMVQRMREGSEKSLRTAESRVTRMSLISTRDLTTSKTRLAEIRAVHEQAREEYTAGNFELSYARYKAARSVSDRLARFLDAQRNLDIDALSLDLAEELLFATGTTSDGVSRTAVLVFETLDEKKATVEESISALMLEEVLSELGEADRTEVEGLLKRARAMVVRATLAEETDDGDHAVRFYASAEETLEEVRTILLSPRPIESYGDESHAEEVTDPEEERPNDVEAVNIDEQHATDTSLSVAHAYAEGVHALSGVIEEACLVDAVASRVNADVKPTLSLQLTATHEEKCTEEFHGAFETKIEASEGLGLTSVVVNGEETAFVIVDKHGDVVEYGTSSKQAVLGTSSTSSENEQRKVPVKGYRATNELLNRVLDDVWSKLR